MPPQRGAADRGKPTGLVKGMKMRPTIGRGDFDTKARKVMEWLAEGLPVVVTIMFRGREVTHPEVGHHLLARLSEATGGTLGPARMEGGRNPLYPHPRSIELGASKMSDVEHFEPERKHRCGFIDSAPDGMVVVCDECGQTWQAFPPRSVGVFITSWFREGWWHRRRRIRRDTRPLLTISEHNDRTRRHVEEWLASIDPPSLTRTRSEPRKDPT